MLPLANRTIALAESRQLEELAQMLEKEGARTLRCPLLRILDAPDDSPLVTWLQQLVAGDFAWVIFLTGEGVRRLLSCAERHRLNEQAIAALGKTSVIVRGPKPVKALKEVGLTPLIIAQPPTTEGVIAALQQEDLRGRAVGVQLYSDSNPPLVDFLQQAGARAVTVQPYVYAPDSDSDRVAPLIEQLAAGQVDALVFTSSPQIDRLFEVAQERGLTEKLRQGLSRTRIASIGPVASENLERHGVHIDVSPEQGFVMKNLVQLLKRALGGEEA
jgi:uroporphyrinogen-III synthase